MRRERAILGCSLALVVLALVPASAGAATFGWDVHAPLGVDRHEYVAAPGEANDLVVTTSAEGPSDYGGGWVTVDDVVDVQPSDPRALDPYYGTCRRPDPVDLTKLSCRFRRNFDDTRLRIQLGDGNDRLSYRNSALRFTKVHIFGDGSERPARAAGNDTLSVEDTISQGVDVNGGPGNDVISGNVLNEWNSMVVPAIYQHRVRPISYSGDEGNDRITCGDLGCGAYGGPGRDVLIGGPGDDMLDGGTLYPPRFRSSLDVRDADVLRGNGGDDRLCGGLGRDSLFGGDGNDVMDPGQTYVRTRTGVKYLPDQGTNDGGPGKNRIFRPTSRITILC